MSLAGTRSSATLLAFLCKAQQPSPSRCLPTAISARLTRQGGSTSLTMEITHYEIGACCSRKMPTLSLGVLMRVNEQSCYLNSHRSALFSSRHHPPLTSLCICSSSSRSEYSSSFSSDTTYLLDCSRSSSVSHSRQPGSSSTDTEQCCRHGPQRRGCRVIGVYCGYPSPKGITRSSQPLPFAPPSALSCLGPALFPD